MASQRFVTEAEMLTLLKEGRLPFAPLQPTEVQTQGLGNVRDGTGAPDALMTLSWRGQSYRFGVELRRLWTPRVVVEATEMARRNASRIGVHPLILVPYLSGERLQALEAQGVSGLDLCGNGVVVVPGELLVLRTGFQNQFRWEAAIKNVYRKDSSIVARAFLLVPAFPSVNEALEQIRQRGGEVSLATVSKVCKSLEADLIIERGTRQPEKCPQPSRVKRSPFLRRLRLLQAEKLLDLLASNYAAPEVRRTFRGKCMLPSGELELRLRRYEEQTGGRVVSTGVSSVDAYAVMARELMRSFYCTDIDKVLASLVGDVRETERFANLTLLETRDNFVYFDRRPVLVASPIQTYLELLTEDKRGRETADQVRQAILGPLVPAQQEG